MKIRQDELIGQLQAQVRLINLKLQRLQSLPNHVLAQKNSPTSWSAYECLEHLAKYGDFYLPEISKQLDAGKLKADKSDWFKSGALGEYFANSMLPKNGKVNKMNTFKNMNPIYGSVDETSMQRFLVQQEELDKLLNESKSVSLVTVKTAISITSLVKIRLGDTFRFFINHIERHVNQALRAAGLD